MASLLHPLRPLALVVALAFPALTLAQEAALPAGPATVPSSSAEPPPAAPAAPNPARADGCGDEPPKGLVKAGLPPWGTGAVVGGLLGALGAGVTGFTLASGVSLAESRRWVAFPYVAGPSLFALALVGIPAGGIAGALAGGILGPMAPRWAGGLFSKPCLRNGNDPTLRSSGGSEQ